jgi:hypothetical protein
LKTPLIAPVLGCVLVCGYWYCGTCDAETGCTEPEQFGIKAAADILVLQLRSPTPEVRENAAKALQAMGKNAASALASHISATEPAEGVTKAITVLAKIGNDVADDEDVRAALLSAAKKWDMRADNWPLLQVQLAAIDALGEINKYRGGIVDKEVCILFSETDVSDPSDFIRNLEDNTNAISICIWKQFSPDKKKLLHDPSKRAAALVAALNKILTGPLYDPTCFANLPQQTKTLTTRQPTGEYLIRLKLITDAFPNQIRRGIHDLGEIVEASDNLASIARKRFDDLTKCALPPTPGPGKPCPDFCCNLMILHESQARMVKLAGDVNVDTSSSEKKESPFPKLADEKILGASLKKIEVGYSDATKEIDDGKLKLEKTYDKTSQQFKTEAAYDLLTEARQLNGQLHDLDKAVADLKKNRGQLIELISALGSISGNAGLNRNAERATGKQIPS